MSKKSDECEWGTCSNPPAYRVFFTGPASTHDYCEDCISTVLERLDYRRSEKL